MSDDQPRRSGSTAQAPELLAVLQTTDASAIFTERWAAHFGCQMRFNLSAD
jgi:hypothetical protein